MVKCLSEFETKFAIRAKGNLIKEFKIGKNKLICFNNLVQIIEVKSQGNSEPPALEREVVLSVEDTVAKIKGPKHRWIMIIIFFHWPITIIMLTEMKLCSSKVLYSKLSCTVICARLSKYAHMMVVSSAFSWHSKTFSDEP